MVKFSKQFEGQLVPEWKEAFVDYWKLKKELKKINLQNAESSLVNKSHISSFRNTLLSSLQKVLIFGCHQRQHHGAIQVDWKSNSLQFV